MSSWVAQLARASVNQGKNLLGVLQGRRPLSNAFTCMTLELDDVGLARQWLVDRSRWGEDDVVRHLGDAFAQANGSRAAFAFASGREALSAGVEALGLEPGSEIVVPGYTCIAVPNALRFAGAVPVFADIETETFGLDVAAAKKAIGPRTRALLVQHTYGLVCRDYEALLDLAASSGLRVIEDCAHATGALYRGVPVGNLGDLAIYSTERSKVLCTMQGGIAATRDPVLAQRLESTWRESRRCDDDMVEQLLRGVIVGYYRHKAPLRAVLGDFVGLLHPGHDLAPKNAAEQRFEKPCGYGRRMAPALAALGIAQLPRLERYAVLRRAAGARWDDWARSRGLVPPRVVDGSVPALLRYPLLVDEQRKRDPRWTEHELGVRAGRWFETNLHPVALRVEGCPNADLAVARCINLPTLAA